MGTITVRTARLYAELTPAGAMERPARLKNDVPGAELDVLRLCALGPGVADDRRARADRARPTS